MSFLISSAVACFAVYLANVAKEEIVGIFAEIVALVTLVISLVLAPLFVQMSILVLVLLWQYPQR
ncbi:MAG: hypothetical protein ABI417_13910 [Coleofasciculaceae cyanobacterium]|jgi:hypothetical protein